MKDSHMPSQLTKNKPIIIAFVLVAAIAIGVGLYVKYRPAAKTAPPQEVFRPKADSKSSNSSSGQAPASPSPSITPTAAPHSSQSGNVTIASPTQGGVVKDGSTVTGMARAFEGQVNYRLKGAASGVLAQGFFHLNGDSSQIQPFSFQLSFEKEVRGGSDQGTLEVYTISPKDGSEVDIASVNVNIQ